jgi:hypothetical protein
MTREAVIVKALEGSITWTQAAVICGVTDRHMRRLRARYEKLEGCGFRDGRKGRAMPLRCVTEEQVRLIERLKREQYPRHSVKHFHEKLTEVHGIALGYSWTRILLVRAGLHEPSETPGPHRKRRPRRAMRGMMVHCDGSTHDWFSTGKPVDLMVFIDDATSEILSAFFVGQEGTRATLRGLKQVVTKWGRFGEFYTDRGAHFCRTSEAGQRPDEEQNGQVARVLRVLGIRAIHANSPQARGRSERPFRTLQDRLVKELSERGIRTMKEGNRYLRGEFIAEYNRRFAVAPEQEGSAFLPLLGVDLALVISMHHERVVRADNTVLFRTQCLQVPESGERVSYARCKVVVHELLNGSLAASFQGKVIARWERPVRRLSTQKALRQAC